MAKPPDGYSIQEGAYFTPKGAGPAVWGGASIAPGTADTQPPAGYHADDGAYFTDDGQGPYAWDGVTMKLIALR